TYSDGTTQNITSSVIWDSSNTTVISVGNTTFDKGFGIARESGTAIIKASLGSISSSDNFVTVNLNNLWVWLSGSSSGSQNGNYGVKGVASVTNIPGSRELAISWTDNIGNMWLFGGRGYASTTNAEELNDLWKYIESTGQWIWVSGSVNSKEQGVYGTKGVAAESNVPGARFGAVSWRDNSGNLWLFGGSNGGSSFNDLWKYVESTNQWTWMSGSRFLGQQGVYGTKGLSAESNVPGARFGAVSWRDNSGNLWLFGGSNGGSSFNDLWKYSVSQNRWVWVSGSNMINQPGIYDDMRVTSPLNVPGARYGASSWVDESTGVLWLFGGLGYDESNNIGYLNDLWKYDISQGQWVWASGSKNIDQFGMYGSKGVAESSNVPGARRGAISWVDKSGNLLLFGGIRYIGSEVTLYNDLWKYDISQNSWIWVSGANYANQAGAYGTKGVSSLNNIPSSRNQAVSWVDQSGNLWLFGGYGFNQLYSFAYMNDLWKYNYN
ncbi:MAG: kelch repeat-containing protein, partial [Neisseriaceae bacterium]